MNFSFEARTRELLRGIWLGGSLSAGAARIGMDTGNAARHLKTAENRIGVRLVDRHRGGRGGPNARLTVAGRRFLHLDTLVGLALPFDAEEGVTPVQLGGRTIFAAGNVRPGPVEIEIRPESVALERASPTRSVSSIRNRFAARVERMREESEGVVRVRLSIGALSIDSLVVRGAVRDLRLRVGSRVHATIKAASVRVLGRNPSPTSS